MSYDINKIVVSGRVGHEEKNEEKQTVKFTLANTYETKNKEDLHARGEGERYIHIYSQLPSTCRGKSGTRAILSCSFSKSISY